MKYIAVCSEHLATAMVVSGVGTYEVRVTQDSFINCCVCDATAKFAFRRPNGSYDSSNNIFAPPSSRVPNPLGGDVLNVNDGD